MGDLPPSMRGLPAGSWPHTRRWGCLCGSHWTCAEMPRVGDLLGFVVMSSAEDRAPLQDSVLLNTGDVFII